MSRAIASYETVKIIYKINSIIKLTQEIFSSISFRNNKLNKNIGFTEKTVQNSFLTQKFYWNFCQNT